MTTTLDPLQCWNACLEKLRSEVAPIQFNTWLKPLSCRLVEEPTTDNPPSLIDEPLSHLYAPQIVITAPARKVVQYVAENFWGRIEAFFTAEGFPVISLRQEKNAMAERTQMIPQRGHSHSIAGLIHTNTPTLPLSEHGDSAIPTIPLPQSISVPVHSLPGALPRLNNGLRGDYNFDNFVIGKSNQLAHAAALQVSEKPGTAYNPFYLYGGVGLGKTHLVQAIGNSLVSRFGLKVRSIHADDYFNEVAKAMRNNTYEQFKQSFRALDVIIIDDVQFLQSRTRTQEELFYLFNALMETGRQVIVTSDRYPRDIEKLDERLRSRFQWGLTVAIEPPEIELRVAILQTKAKSMGFELDTASAYYIARHIKSTVRELEGALTKVVAYTRFHHLPINADSVRLALKDIIGHVSSPLTIESIQKAVCDLCKVRPADMHSKSRTRNVVRARQMAMWLTRELTTMSLPTIGQSFGGRDHTTVIHACRTVEALRQKNTGFNQELRILEQMMKGE